MPTVQVKASRSYEVKIAGGLLSNLGQEVLAYVSGQVLVVTDENVAPLYLARVYESLAAAGLKVATVSVPAGEQSKSMECYVNLLGFLSEKNFTRADGIIALGGGVVGDLAGFTAATYLRGITLIQVPTTLLSMVDSGVGGKTAVNLPKGKNLVGAFYQPSLVLCDTATLATLPEPELRNGCAEILKMAVLFDEALFHHLKTNGTNFDREYVISRCVELKAAIVEQDETEQGNRKLLNLGHTFGHAIEKVSGYTVSHGQAVAIGMAIMARAFCQNAPEILSVLVQFGLPISTDLMPETIENAALSDKKCSGDSITLAIPIAIGSCELQTVPTKDLNKIIQAGLR